MVLGGGCFLMSEVLLCCMQYRRVVWNDGTSFARELGHPPLTGCPARRVSELGRRVWIPAHPRGRLQVRRGTLACGCHPNSLLDCCRAKRKHLTEDFFLNAKAIASCRRDSARSAAGGRRGEAAAGCTSVASDCLNVRYTYRLQARRGTRDCALSP